jgi:hypothetical protein
MSERKDLEAIDEAALGDPSGTREMEGLGRGRRIAFRVFAIVVSLSLLVLMVFSLLEAVIMWLSWDTLMSFIDDLPAGDEIHRAHFNIVGIVSWALVTGVVVQLRKPERRTAAMLQAVGIVVAGMAFYGLSGTITEWLTEDVAPVVFVLILAWLHPRARELVKMPRLEPRMAGLVALAAVPWLVFITNQAILQWRNVAGDTHAEMEHWATAALLGIVVLWCGLVGSSDHSGWRLPAWIAGLASIDYGLHSLVFPEAASNASTSWGVAAVIWGFTFLAAAITRSRGAVVDDSAVEEGATVEPK